MKALLLAGGQGTRLRPLTIHSPKPIVPILDRPFLHYQLDLIRQVPEIDEVILSLAGFDNTHAASLLAFTFYDTTGKAISPGLIQSDVTVPFANYYKAHREAGGVFNLQATFPVTGDITRIAGVDVQFTNPAGVTQTSRLPVQ